MNRTSSHRRGSKWRRLAFAALVLCVCSLPFWGPRVLCRWHIHQGRALLDERRPEKAAAAFEAALSWNGQSAAAHYGLARAQRHLGKLEQVRVQLQKAWEFGAPRELLEHEQWLALAQSGQMAEAEPHLRELLLSESVDDREVCEAFVNGYLRTLRFSEAMPLLDAWQSDYPEDPRPHVIRGMILEHLLQLQNALGEYRRAQELGDGSSELCFRTANLLQNLNKLAEASAQYERCFNDPQVGLEALAGWARCQRELGRAEVARRAYQKVLASDPEHFAARLGLGQLAVAAGEDARALQLLMPLLEVEPRSIPLRQAIASALVATKRADEAAEHFAWVEKANAAHERVALLVQQVISHPKDVTARLEIGELLLEYGSPAEGATWLLGVLELEPQNLRAHRLLAEYYGKNGQASEAARHRAALESLRH